MKKITVKDLNNFKGNTKLVCLCIKNVNEALAADQVGIEMLGTGAPGVYRNDDGHLCDWVCRLNDRDPPWFPPLRRIIDCSRSQNDRTLP